MLRYVSAPFLKKYIVTRTVIGKESLAALHLNCGKNLTGN